MVNGRILFVCCFVNVIIICELFCVCGAQVKGQPGGVSSPIVWVLGIALRLSALAASLPAELSYQP